MVRPGPGYGQAWTWVWSGLDLDMVRPGPGYGQAWTWIWSAWTWIWSGLDLDMVRPGPGYGQDSCGPARSKPLIFFAKFFSAACWKDHIHRLLAISSADMGDSDWICLL